ncbi:RraA family protein [Carnobacterium sp. TMP28]|uniref:RraA family protein n=1 Tax=Carnobacterium sp. TMP28 TaxID=3397060 RepID=UPI0039DF4883
MNKIIKKETIEEFKKLDSCTISDAFDELRIGQGGYISPKQMNGDTKICGQVFTVRYLPKQANQRNFGTFLEEIPEGRVVVIDNQGRMDGSVWGDTMALYAQKKGVSGVVVNGVYRDVGPIQELGFPVFAKGYSSRSGKDLVSVDAINVAIQVDNSLIEPDDLIFGDESGVMVIPFDQVEKVLIETKKLKKKDEQFIKQLHTGLTYNEAKKTN